MVIKESCDPLLVLLLLQAAERRNINLVNKGDYRGDTALHYAALRNDIALPQQVRVFLLLVRYGAGSNRCGSQGRTPLALVSPERKHVSFTFTLTLRLLMSYIYGAPSKARNANVVYIWTYVWQR